MDASTLREGIFALNTRRFGTVCEVLIKRLVGLAKARSLFHDLYDDFRGKRVEVKFSVVRRTAQTRVTEDKVLQCIEEATSEQRMVPFGSWQTATFDCNIQQIKRREFDVLYYGLFFEDQVVIFKIASDEIEAAGIYYSDFQHKGNVGEGQFHINQETLGIHLRQHHYKTLTYEELLDLLSQPG